MKISELKPTALWSFFENITRIPRPSKHEEKILAWLRSFAQERGLVYRQDAAGNIVIRKPAQNSSSTETVILQSHVDMVCEKDSDVKIDFLNDPIEAYIDGNFIKAHGTTLGADCGIGMASALYVLDSKELSHPPIEALFTVDEETGLTGAFSLEADMLTGKRLINLDSEDEEQVFIGCAGGIDTVASFHAERQEAPKGVVAVRISVGGLCGGHSGDNINSGLANANLLLARVCHELKKEIPLFIADIDGGNLRNAIPREATVTLAVEPSQIPFIESTVRIIEKAAKAEYHRTEASLKITSEKGGDISGKVLCAELSGRLIDSIFTAVNGVTAFSQDIEGFVETSTNLASIKIKGDEIVISTSQRSSIDSKKEWLSDMIKTHFESFGATVWQSDGYPGWAPVTDSPIVEKTVEAYRKVYGRLPQVKAIHAGLECGLFLAVKPELDMVSIGPDIKNVHSPSERLDIESTVKFAEVLETLLASL